MAVGISKGFAPRRIKVLLRPLPPDNKIAVRSRDLHGDPNYSFIGEGRAGRRHMSENLPVLLAFLISEDVQRTAKAASARAGRSRIWLTIVAKWL
jgi:hypothetical protein